jgi:Protein of unknown function (DUF3999)
MTTASQPFAPFLRGLTLAAAVALPVAPRVARAAADAGKPDAYALRLSVTPAPDAALQRVVLPAQALVRLQEPGYADLRLFNAQGQAVPMALAGVAAAAPAARPQTRLPAYPILGGATSAGIDGLSLRIEERNGKRVVQLNTGTAGSAPAGQQVLGALLDARAVTGPISTITLDVDLPLNQPATFRLQTSRDLKSWAPLADTVLYRGDAASTGSNLGTDNIEVALADLSGQYVRITWSDSAGQNVPVTLRGAALTTAVNGAPQRVSASLATPTLTNAHELSFALPFATPVAALAITPQGSNVLVPVRIFGRNDRSQPWAQIASTVVYRLTTGGKEQLSGPIELQGVAVREIKVEADAKTPGFAAAPAIALQFEPVQLVFLAGGPAPFTLATGLAGAVGAYLPVSNLIPGYKPAQENTLPAAKVDTAAAGSDAALVPNAAGGDTVATRSLVLWGILLLGVIALAAMAWVLMKQNRKTA